MIEKEILDKFNVDFIKLKTDFKSGKITADEMNNQYPQLVKIKDDELEAIGILTSARKQLRDKEAFAKATQEEKINMLAERLGLK